MTWSLKLFSALYHAINFNTHTEWKRWDDYKSKRKYLIVEFHRRTFLKGNSLDRRLSDICEHKSDLEPAGVNNLGGG